MLHFCRIICFKSKSIKHQITNDVKQREKESEKEREREVMRRNVA